VRKGQLLTACPERREASGEADEGGEGGEDVQRGSAAIRPDPDATVHGSLPRVEDGRRLRLNRFVRPSVSDVPATAPPGWGPLLALLGLALAVRLAALVLLPDPGFQDARVYEEAGRTLLAEGWLGVHNCMPLYPLLSGATGGGIGTRLLDVLLSVATVALVVRLGWRLFDDRRVALAAGLVASLWPHLVFASIAGLTETSFTFTLCLGLVLWLERRWAAGSLALVLGVLIRPTFELLLPLLLVATVLGFHGGRGRDLLRPLAILAAIYAMTMAPWWAHNRAEYGTFVRLNTGAGLVAYVGQHPRNPAGGGLATAPDLDLGAYREIEDPVERDRALRDAALGFVLDDPAAAARRIPTRLMRLWRPWPNAEQHRSPAVLLVSAATFLPLAVLALLHLGLHTRRTWRSVLLLWLPVVFLSAVHGLTLASVRYRLPVEPLLILLAVHAGSCAARAPTRHER